MGEPGNAYEITFHEYPEYLYVYVKADRLEAPGISAYMNEIADRCHSGGYIRVLLERDIAHSQDPYKSFGTANEAVKVSMRLKVAVVNNRPEQAEDLRFKLNIVKNRGGNFGLFDNVDDAKAWLLEHKMAQPNVSDHAADAPTAG